MKGCGCVWLGVLIVLGTQALGHASPMEQVLELVSKVDSRYEQTQDLQADFSQETKIEGFETGVVEKAWHASLGLCGAFCGTDFC